MNFEQFEPDAVRAARASRRFELRDYARDQLAGPESSAQALVNIVAKAVDLSLGSPRFGETRDQQVMNDLFAVVVGDGWTTGEGRGTGEYYVGTNYPGGDGQFFGDDGFKPEFRDQGGSPGFQVHHAVAGLVMAYRFGGGVEAFAKWHEDEPEDDALYDAVFSIGNWLAPFWGSAEKEDLEALPQRILDAVCDGTCVLPSADAVDSDGDGILDMTMAAPGGGSGDTDDSGMSYPDDDYGSDEAGMSYPDDDYGSDEAGMSYPDDDHGSDEGTGGAPAPVSEGDGGYGDGGEGGAVVSPPGQ